MGRTVNVVTAHTTRPEHVEPLRRLLALDRYPGAAAELNRTIRCLPTPLLRSRIPLLKLWGMCARVYTDAISTTQPQLLSC
jgi:hypothetical protein